MSNEMRTDECSEIKEALFTLGERRESQPQTVVTRGNMERDIKVTSNNIDVCFDRAAAPAALEACLR